MDILRYLELSNEQDRLSRARYHVTLGELIETLKDIPEQAIVSLEDGRHPSSPHSYRGYYSDLSFSPSDKQITAGELLKEAEESLGETFEGYKGGDFVMAADTPLWIAYYGTTGEAIMDVIFDGENVLIKSRIVD